MAIFACGDGSKNDEPQHQSSQTELQKGQKTEIDPRFLPRSIAIRDDGSWRIHVTLPESLPQGAGAETITCKTAEESHTLTIDSAMKDPLEFALDGKTRSYELILSDSNKKTYRILVHLE